MWRLPRLLGQVGALAMASLASHAAAAWEILADHLDPDRMTIFVGDDAITEAADDMEGFVENLRRDYHDAAECEASGCAREDCYWGWVRWIDAEG